MSKYATHAVVDGVADVPITVHYSAIAVQAQPTRYGKANIQVPQHTINRIEGLFGETIKLSPGQEAAVLTEIEDWLTYM